jgi:hypothetical protein
MKFNCLSADKKLTIDLRETIAMLKIAIDLEWSAETSHIDVCQRRRAFECTSAKRIA